MTNKLKALSIAGVYSKTSTFYKKGTANEKGTQIDLLLDRNDKVINIFEIKYHNSEFTVTENYAKKLKEKMQVFQEVTKTRKYLMLVFIASSGVKSNPHSLGLVEQVVGLEELFEA